MVQVPPRFTPDVLKQPANYGVLALLAGTWVNPLRLNAYFIASLLSLGCTPSAPPSGASLPGPTPQTKRAAPDDTAIATMVRRALPSVALVLADKENGKIGYGAGLIVGKDGRILTNHHVIEGAKKLGVMLYSTKRLSYTPMDGGLDRYIFENAKDILPVILEREDAVGDLAVLKGEFDTSFAPTLAFSNAPLSLGDKVYALGHPQETVWSFTAGTVSALHVGAIQHDAVVSRGSSGGPLLNARGEVIGINTARVVSEARGFAFARPIAMADRLLNPRAAGLDELDLGTPERAMFSCWHAIELERPSAKDCYDWTAIWAVLQQGVARLMERPPPGIREDALKAFKAFLEEPSALERTKREAETDRTWAPFFMPAPPLRQVAIFALRAAKVVPLDEPLKRPAPEPPEVVEARELYLKRLLERGIKPADGVRLAPREVKETLRKGARIDESKATGEKKRWFLIAGRNLDGSIYRYSELWVEVGGKWLQREPPLEADVVELPVGWPEPVRTVGPIVRAIAADVAVSLGAK